MRIVETRFLEGPNIFMLEPAVKIELDTGTEVVTDDHMSTAEELAGIVRDAYLDAGLREPSIILEPMEVPGHLALAYGWSNRRFAKAVADRIGQSVEGIDAAGSGVTELASILDESLPDDLPEMISDSERGKLTIGVTGTNGKTTTTRLIAHLFAQTGKRVGWSCSSGVYIEGEEVLAGDYSGPRGAQRVIQDPGVEVAVVELARGGILLRGLACQSLDVSVYTNISADHLDLQGIRTVQGLARSKAVVARITRPDGYAVVNADDPLVMEATQNIRASRVLTSQNPDNPHLQAHIQAGGCALVNADGLIVYHADGNSTVLCRVEAIPMTYGGSAGFMIENALGGAAAALMGGLTLDQVRAGLETFDNSSDKNPGRLNVYNVNGVTVVLDFAHNEAGLLVLLNFSRSLLGERGEIHAVVGTAGDRTAESIRELGRIAGLWADHIVVKDTRKYLRGRDSRELLDLYAEGYRMSGSDRATYEEAPDELAAVEVAVSRARAGDVVAIMSHESAPEIRELLIGQGGRAV